MNQSKPQISVIGAGLQGTCVSLALAARGYKVTLLERNSQPLQAASLRNEGKIHLGFVYALDENGATRRLMLKGALSFSKIIERYCGAVPWNRWKSGNFLYAVHPDSLLSSTLVAESFKELASYLLPDGDLQYLGSHLSWFWQRADLDRHSSYINPRQFDGLFETEEVSLDPRSLSQFLTSALKSTSVDLQLNTKVLEANCRQNSFELKTEAHQQFGSVKSDLVVNCSWDDRLRLDASAGITDFFGGNLYRVKYQVIAKPVTPITLNVTMVLGPYGDVVSWPDGTVYLSWYPIGRTYFSTVPPDPELLDDSGLASRIATESLAHLAELFPVLRSAEIISSLPGVIMARGSTDVDHKTSQLHNRNEIGFRDYQGWISVDTGKLTTAPLFAEEVAQWIDDNYSNGIVANLPSQTQFVGKCPNG